MTKPTSPRVLVTGGGSGIGRACALRLARAGCNVTITGRRADALAETVKCAEGHGPSMQVIVADLAAPGTPTAIINEMGTAHGGIDMLVNNAARGELVDLADTTADLIDQTFDLNFRATLELTLEALKHMRQQRNGRIVNISSMATVSPFPGLGIYAASKCAVDSITRSIMNEYADDGLLAFSVAPGAVETALLRSIIDDTALPPSMTLDPDDIAVVVEACLLGHRDADAGTVICVPSPSG